MNATVIWRPQSLTAALHRAVAPAAAQWKTAAARNSPSKTAAASLRVSASSTGASISGNRLVKWIETGTSAHTIAPKGRVLRLADGRFVTGPVHHPGTPARPFLRPLLGAWASLYRRAAAAALRGAGFGGF